jgi:tetratricopeptide (TPR) repeat protein
VDQNLELALWNLQERVVDAIGTSDMGRGMWAAADRESGAELLLPLIDNLGDLMAEAVTLLAQQTAQLKGITELLANPEETRAAEFYKRGEKALNSDWFDEALVDLNRAIEASPFHYPSYLLLGRLHLRQDQLSDAATAFTKTLRYAGPQDSLAAAGAGVSALGLFEQLGDRAGLVKVAEEARLAFRKAIDENSKSSRMPVPSELFLRLSWALNEPIFGVWALASNPALLPVASISMTPSLLEQVLTQATMTLTKRLQAALPIAEEAAEHLARNIGPELQYGPKCGVCDGPIMGAVGPREWPYCQADYSAPKVNVTDPHDALNRLHEARSYQERMASSRDPSKVFEYLASAEYLAYQAAILLTRACNSLKYSHQINYTGSLTWQAAPPYMIILGRKGITSAHQSWARKH